MADLTKEQQAEIRGYLERYRTGGDADTLIIRAGNALLRNKVITMANAAKLTDEKIARMRHVGVKTKDFIRLVIEDYKREQAEGANVYLTQNGESDLVVMDVESFRRREQMLKLREELLAVEEDRAAGRQGCSPDELEAHLTGIIDAVENGHVNRFSQL